MGARRLGCQWVTAWVTADALKVGHCGPMYAYVNTFVHMEAAFLRTAAPNTMLGERRGLFPPGVGNNKSVDLFGLIMKE